VVAGESMGGQWQQPGTIGRHQHRVGTGLTVGVKEREGEEEGNNGIWHLLDICLIYLDTWLRFTLQKVVLC